MSFKSLEQAVVSLTTNVMGDSYLYTASGGSPVTIKAVFNNAWLEVEGVMSYKPVLRVSLVDLQFTPGKGDQVQIGSVNYKIMESKVDGHGGSNLILQKV